MLDFPDVISLSFLWKSNLIPFAICEDFCSTMMKSSLQVCSDGSKWLMTAWILITGFLTNCYLVTLSVGPSQRALPSPSSLLFSIPYTRKISLKDASKNYYLPLPVRPCATFPSIRLIRNSINSFQFVKTSEKFRSSNKVSSIETNKKAFGSICVPMHLLFAAL